MKANESKMALSANELRIGNLLQGYNEVRTIAELHKDCYTDTKGVSTLYRDADGIPLTEEWLSKFGLVKGVFPDNEYFSIRTPEIGTYWAIYLENEYTAVDIQYVHQLQNLYFALTGEELCRQEREYR